jgi:hypothetical protein
VFLDASPAAFGHWVSEIVARGRSAARPAAPIFINSWNEWAEGAQLEPCSVFGRGFLEALRDALSAARDRELSEATV